MLSRKQTKPMFREGKKTPVEVKKSNQIFGQSAINTWSWAILVMGNLGWNSKLLMVFSSSPYAIALIEISVDLKLPYLKIEKQNLNNK